MNCPSNLASRSDLPFPSLAEPTKGAPPNVVPGEAASGVTSVTLGSQVLAPVAEAALPSQFRQVGAVPHYLFIAETVIGVVAVDLVFTTRESERIFQYVHVLRLAPGVCVGEMAL